MPKLLSVLHKIICQGGDSNRNPLHVIYAEILKVIILIQTLDFPLFLYVRCKLGVTFVWSCSSRNGINAKYAVALTYRNDPKFSDR